MPSDRKRAQESSDESSNSDLELPSSIKKPRIEDFSPQKGGRNTQTSISPSRRTSEANSKMKTNADGEKYMDLGKQKRVTIRKFKGTPLVDIREYYKDASGHEKPGKKGISMTVDQWHTLKLNVNELDQHLSAMKDSE